MFSDNITFLYSLPSFPYPVLPFHSNCWSFAKNRDSQRWPLTPHFPTLQVIKAKSPYLRVAPNMARRAIIQHSHFTTFSRLDTYYFITHPLWCSVSLVSPVWQCHSQEQIKLQNDVQICARKSHNHWGRVRYAYCEATKMACEISKSFLFYSSQLLFVFRGIFLGLSRGLVHCQNVHAPYNSLYELGLGAYNYYYLLFILLLLLLNPISAPSNPAISIYQKTWESASITVDEAQSSFLVVRHVSITEWYYTVTGPFKIRQMVRFARTFMEFSRRGFDRARGWGVFWWGSID